MYAFFALIGVAAYFAAYFLMGEKAEKINRRNSNRMLLVMIIGLAGMFVFALFFNSLYHSIEKQQLVIGGITWLGGIIGTFPLILFCIHKLVPAAKGNALEYFSYLIPGIVLGHAFGRVGCFFGGCCFGTVTDGPFGVVFPAGSPAADAYPAVPGDPNTVSLPVLPTQLFEAGFCLILFIVLVVLDVKLGKKFKKYNLPIYLLAYGVFRFILEFWRGDDRGSLIWLSPSQWNCIICIVEGVLILLFQKGILFKKLNAKCVQWQEQALQNEKQIIEKEQVDAELLRDYYRLKAQETEKPEQQTADSARLRELHALFTDGVLTQEEYEEKKQEILKRM